MADAIPLVIIFSLGVGIVLLALYLRIRPWMRQVKRLGLTRADGGGLFSRAWEGRHGDVTVRIGLFPTKHMTRKEGYPFIAVSTRPFAAPYDYWGGVELRSRLPIPGQKGIRELEAVSTRSTDPAFDLSYLAFADRSDLLGVLDDTTRALFCALAGAKMRVELLEGELVMTEYVHAGVKKGPCEDVPGSVDRLIELGNRLLMSAEDVPRKLASNAKSSENPDLRAASMEELLRRFAGSNEAVRAVEDAVRHDDPWVLLAIGKHRGAGGRDLLERLASDTSGPETVRIKALRALDAVLDAKSLEPFVRSILGADTNRSAVVRRWAGEWVQANGGGFEGGELALSAPGADGGELALAGEEGGMSFPGDEASDPAPHQQVVKETEEMPTLWRHGRRPGVMSAVATLFGGLVALSGALVVAGRENNVAGVLLIVIGIAFGLFLFEFIAFTERWEVDRARGVFRYHVGNLVTRNHIEIPLVDVRAVGVRGGSGFESTRLHVYILGHDDEWRVNAKIRAGISGLDKIARDLATALDVPLIGE